MGLVTRQEINRTMNTAENSPSSLIVWAYRFTALRRVCLWWCNRFDGSQFYSATLRQILNTYHGVVVGRYSYGPVLEPGVLPKGTRVGSYCSVGGCLAVRRRNHPIDRFTQHPFFYNGRLGYVAHDTIPHDEDNPLVIGNDVWIGEQVIILPGCRSIGDGAVIAAGAVVTHDVEPYCIVAGVPARPLGKRFDDALIERLVKLRWWEMPVERLAAVQPGLLKPLTPDVLESIVSRLGRGA